MVQRPVVLGGEVGTHWDHAEASSMIKCHLKPPEESEEILIIDVGFT